MEVRALFRAVAVPGYDAPYNCVQLKIFYPAKFGDSQYERDTGFIPADPESAPYPLVILLPGVNVPGEFYSWLARGLAQQGVLCVLYDWVAEEMPGLVSITPGVQLEALGQAGFGRSPSCPVIAPILDEIAVLNGDGLLAGMLDLDSIVLVGHSAGGTMALLNANNVWFPGLKGVCAYAAHTCASTMLGWPEETYLPIPAALPVLLMGGSEDGVIAASAFRYGDEAAGGSRSATYRIEQTFEQALDAGRAAARYLLIQGANHFSFTCPDDATTGRPFLDHPAIGDQQVQRKFFTRLIAAFCRDAVAGDEHLSGLDGAVAEQRTLVSGYRRKTDSR